MADRKPLKKGGVLSRSWKRVLGGFRRHKSSADGDARRSAQAEPPPRRPVSLNKAALADAKRRNVVPEDSPKWLKSLVKDGDAALAELPTLPSTDGIEGLGGSFGSGDGLSRDSESTERSSSMSSRGTRPLEVQRGLSTTGRVPRIASAELEAFVEAGVAPPSTHPPRQRVVRFNSVVDDSEPGTPPPDSCETVRKAGARPGLSKHRKCLLTCAGHNATLVPHTCCSGRHGGDTGPKRNGVRLVGVLCIILAFVLSWVMIICCFARWRGEGRFAKSTKEAPLAVVGKVFDLEQPVSTKSFVFSEDTLTSVDEAPPKAELVYADAPAVEVVVKTATARPARGVGGHGPA